MKFSMRRSLYLLFIFFLWVGISGQTCTKVMVHDANYDTDPRKFTFSNSHDDVIAAIKKTFDRFGYQVHIDDEEKGHFETGWRSTEAESHYFNLFGRKDYGVADGAYYRLVIDVIPENNYQKVLVSTIVKTIAGKLESSGKVEAKVLDQMKNYLQASQIDMTNVGVEKK
jgi:hypothetical protein